MSTYHVNTAPKAIRLDQVSSCVGFKKSKIYGMISQKLFPPPMKIGKASRWLQSDIDDWILTHASNRDETNQGGK